MRRIRVRLGGEIDLGVVQAGRGGGYMWGDEGAARLWEEIKGTDDGSIARKR